MVENGASVVRFRQCSEDAEVVRSGDVAVEGGGGVVGVVGGGGGGVAGPEDVVFG